MRKIFGAVILLGVLLVTEIPGYAAPPAVDGFIGVPWGASRAQVEAAMAKKGFPLIEQKAWRDGSTLEDRYQGTFADHPAQLTFLYNKNILYFGKAAFLDTKGIVLGKPPVVLRRYEKTVCCKIWSA